MAAVVSRLLMRFMYWYAKPSTIPVCNHSALACGETFFHHKFAAIQNLNWFLFSTGK